MASNHVGMNNNNSAAGEASAKGTVAAATAEEDTAPAHGPVSTTAVAAADHPRQQQSNEEISDFSDKQLKALLDEAMTYKNPKDLAHKSETFKELLRRAETEEQSQESSFVYIPFTSSGGGSLQNIFESVNSEPRKYSSAGSSNPRRHHISGHGYGRHSQSHYHGGASGHAVGGAAAGAGGASGVSAGTAGSDGHQQHHRRQGNHRGHASGTGFVSSRQGEGGSLPSNVNTRSAEVHPFIAEMAAVPRRTTKGSKNNSESSRASDEYEMGVMNGMGEGVPMSKAAARSVAARGTSVGLDTDIPYAQMESLNSRSVIINMGDSGAEDQTDDQLMTTQAKKVTSHQQYRTNLKIDIEHGADHHEKVATGGTMGGYEKLSTASGLSAIGSASAGLPRAEMMQSSSYEHVDKSIKLSLEPRGGGSLDPLANAYVSVKNGRGDQKSEMIIVTPSSVAQSHDREMTADLDWTRSMSMVQQKRILKNRRKYERNMTTIVSDEIAGFRGEEMDLDRLVQFIESKENELQQTGAQKQPADAKGKGKNKGTNKKDQQGGGKLKKSNSMNELRSCSKLDEITSEKESTANGGPGVVLRPKNATKNSNKSTTATAQNESKSGQSQNGGGDVKSATVTGKRGDRRSWGTEELQYLGESEAAVASAEPSFIVDTNNNMSALKKNHKKQLPEKSSELSIPTKTLGELPVNSVSMESLVSSSWANEEFHVVTKKRKSKKKQSIVVQPFEVERRTFNQSSSSSAVANGGGKVAMGGRSTTSAEYTACLGSQKNAKNRPNNLIASITNTNSSSSNGGGGAAAAGGHHRTTIHNATTGSSSSGRTSSLHPSASQSKSRRKSTSSVPPSDHSDCSDLDSVHSLPIESPSTTKSKATAKSKAKQAAAAAAASSSNTGNGGSQGISYADITKTAASQKPPPPPSSLLQATQTAAATAACTTKVNGLAAAEDVNVKWPTIDGRHESEDAEIAAVAEKPKWVNGGVGAMSEVIRNSQASVVRSTEVINVTVAVLGDLSSGGAGGNNNKTLLQKSKSVDHESSGFNMNIDQYPSLEKTVNKSKQQQQLPSTGPGVVGVVVNNKDSPVVATVVVTNNCSTTVPVMMTATTMMNGAAGKKSKLLSSIVSDSSSTGGVDQQQQTNSTVNRVSPVANSNHVTSVACPVLPNNNGHNNNNGPQQQQEGEVREPVASAVDSVNSREKKMAVKTNNNLSMLTTSGGVVSKDLTQQPSVVVAKGAGKGASGGGGGQNKSNRNRTNSMPQITPNASSLASSGAGSNASQPQQQQRPAVIILNDERYNSLNESSDITFGFDVNNQLLFGDFEEDEIRFLEPYNAGSQETVQLMNDSDKNAVDNINTSDYNSYNSSLCSSSSVKTATQATTITNAEGLVFDSNSNPNDDTAEELEVPPVSQQPQSTPKQQQAASVSNCSNCTRTNAPSGGEGIGEGMALMKNSCVQTSLDNLIMATDLKVTSATSSEKGVKGVAVVVTVSDLESRNAAAAAAAAAASSAVGGGATGGKKKNKKGGGGAAVAQAAVSNNCPPNWADAASDLVDANGNPVVMTGDERRDQDGAEGGAGEGFDSIKAKLQQFALINAQFARQAPMGWMCNQMNSFFNNHENVINFVGLAWEDLTHNKGSALKYYNGQ